jgi:uncharacterized protein
MNKILYPWGSTRRFNSWASYCIRHFGSRIQKVSVNAGFTCPNRDGSVGVGGCTFCNNHGFNPSYCHDGNSISIQIDQGVRFLKTRYRKAKTFIAYFQAYSNTYDSLQNLKTLYEEALQHPEISGISVGTRPDCVDDEKLNYLAQLAEKYIVSVEYGVESCYEETLLKINRGHTFETSRQAIHKTAALGLHTTIHLIIGLPGESREQMLAQSRIISQLPISSVKFHQLQIVKDTAMAVQYQNSPDDFHFFEIEEYVDFMVEFLEYLRPDISIERFAGEVPPAYNVRPSWNQLRSDQITLLIEKKLEEKNTWQGIKYTPNH